MMVIAMLVKDKIKELRKQNGYSMAEFAKELGVSQGNVSRYENGSVRRIPDHILEKMAVVLNCSMNELISDDKTYTHLQDPNTRKQLSNEADDDQFILNCYHNMTEDTKIMVRKIMQALS